MMDTQRHIPRISEVLYIGLCGIIGTSSQVKNRRDVMDTIDMICQHVEKYRGYRDMISGSMREGFRMTTSDIDFMIWYSDDIVISDLSQIPLYHPTKNLIVMECHDTPPGFAKLQLLIPANDSYIIQSCVSVNDLMYISSSLFKEAMKSSAQSDPFFQSATIHGPCTNGVLMSILEYDYAYCFHCNQWPYLANQWIERCNRYRWPSSQVLHNIISDGCHLVAMGSGRSSQHCETEWRISFSQAEYKLVSSMNHTQFLCYGVLKIFLKEVLNIGLENPLLCSYFIKTSLFWKIQDNRVSVWCSKNILHCVWMCFKYLCQCVYRGEFPNFFIPQNNMFINKVHGAAQKQLFLQLLTLYNMGFSCLLLSPSLYKILSKAILNPQLQIYTDETEFDLDVELFKETLQTVGVFCFNEDFISKSFQYANSIDYLYKTCSLSSQNHIAVLHVMRNLVLVRHAFCLDKSREDSNMHTTDNCRPLDMLTSAAESGFISDTLYVAIYLYNKNKYKEALYYIEKTKQKLSHPNILHIGTENVNRDRYLEAVGGQSLIDKIKMSVSSFIFLDPICCIDEVRLEVCVNMQNGLNHLNVPSVVMTHMLSFLCHHHLGDSLRSRQSLDDLETLLHYEDGQFINSHCRDISWQMLGVCEQIHGDKERALYSYQESITQSPLHRIHTASWIRIQNIISKQNDYL